MRVAVDSSVLLDVLGADPVFGERSGAALRRTHDTGSLVISDVAWAEVRANFDSEAAFGVAVASLGLVYLPTSAEAAGLAGTNWRRYHEHRRRQRVPARDGKRVAADFLIGAHAQVQADALLARDRGFFRIYFRGLRVIGP